MGYIKRREIEEIVAVAFSIGVGIGVVVGLVLMAVVSFAFGWW